jgi:hypothetical protein
MNASTPQRTDPVRADAGRPATDATSPDRAELEQQITRAVEAKIVANSRKIGYVVAAAVNVLVLWIANQLLDWEWPSFLTSEFDELLPIITVSCVAGVMVNLVLVWRDPPPAQVVRQPGHVGDRLHRRRVDLPGVPVRLLVVVDRLVVAGAPRRDRRVDRDGRGRHGGALPARVGELCRPPLTDPSLTDRSTPWRRRCGMSPDTVFRSVRAGYLLVRGTRTTLRREARQRAPRPP